MVVLGGVAGALLAGPPLSQAAPAQQPPLAAIPSAVWSVVPTGQPAFDLAGYSPSTQIDVRVPAGFAPAADGQLTLGYTASPLVTNAVLTVSLNGKLVSSAKLAPELGQLVATLPAALLRTGTNQVVIDASIPLSIDADCPDSSHPARHVTFDPSSRVTLALQPTELTLTDFPEALEPLGYDNRVLTVVVPDAPAADDLSAAAVVVAAIRNSAATSVPIVVKSLADPTPSVGPEVIVGTADELAAAAVNPLPGKINDGFVSITHNAAGQSSLVVSGSTALEVLQAATALTDPIARARFTGASSAVDGAITSVDQIAKWAPAFSFADLGYKARTISGPGTDGAVYSFDIPTSEQTNRVTFAVNAARSASTINHTDGLSILLNGQLVGSLKFDTKTGVIAEGTLTVSGDVLRPGRNFVRLEAEFSGAIVNCTSVRNLDESITIAETTRLTLETGTGPAQLDLNDVPYLFRAPADSASLVVVTPSQPMPADFAAAIDVATLLGREVGPARIALTDKALTTGANALSHFVLLGEADRQPLLADLGVGIADRVVTPARPDQLAVSDVRFDGLVEVLRSPWTASQGVLVITGRNHSGYTEAVRSVLDVAARGGLDGPATLVGTNPDLSLQLLPVAPTAHPVQAAAPVAADVIAPTTTTTPVPVTTAPPVKAAPGANKQATWWALGAAILVVLGLGVLIFRIRRA
jgi:hypothetical protein